MNILFGTFLYCNNILEITYGKILYNFWEQILYINEK